MMCKQPMKFSIIIPVYNSEAFLHKCIDSIVLQPFTDYELILVDDGSTDESLSICRNYEHDYPQVRVIAQQNGGPSAARNAGLQEAQGEYILFVDSDDWVTSDYFAQLSEAAAKQPDLIIFGRAGASGNAAEYKNYPDFSGNQKDAVEFFASNHEKGDLHSCANKAFSRRLLENGGVCFPVGTVVEEDLLFVMRALDHAETVQVLERTLYCYNQRSAGSVTTRYNPRKFDCKLAAYAEEMHYVEKWQSHKFAEIFRRGLLSYVSSCIFNLFYAACPLKPADKLQEIRRYFRTPEVRLCAEEATPCGIREKLMVHLIRANACRTAYMIHWAVFRSRGR